MHVRHASAPLCERRLVDCGGAKGGLDRKRLHSLNMVEDEPFALFCYRTAHLARDCAATAEDLSTAVINVEPIDTERTNLLVLPLPLPGGPATTNMRGRVIVRQPVSSVVSDSGSISGGRSREMSSPSSPMMPSRSRRARSAAMRVAAAC